MNKQTARTLDQYKHESFEDLKQLDSEKLIKMRDRAGDLVNETNNAHREALLHWTHIINELSARGVIPANTDRQDRAKKIHGMFYKEQ